MTHMTTDTSRFEKYQAAKRALSIANTLPPSQYRKKHVSNIFSHMNKLRIDLGPQRRAENDY